MKAPTRIVIVNHHCLQKKTMITPIFMYHNGVFPVPRGNITGPVSTIQNTGSVVTLECTVNDLGSDILIWAENATSANGGSGNILYDSRNEYNSEHPRYGGFYVKRNTTGLESRFLLSINSTQPGDAGTYGCKRQYEDVHYLGADLIVIGELRCTPLSFMISYFHILYNDTHSLIPILPIFSV